MIQVTVTLGAPDPERSADQCDSHLFYRAEMGCYEFSSYKDSTQSQLFASWRCVDDPAKDCQIQDLSRDTLRLPMIPMRLFAMG